MSADLSLIIPVYNEEDNVRPMWEAVAAALHDLPLSAEILFVDDGSKDRTVERLKALPKDQGPPVRIVKFRRNYGQTAAMMAGIDHARGRVLVTMDGDLQNDPRDIPRFLAKIDEGYDLVVGWRKNRQDHWSRVLPSKVANRLIGWVTGVPIKDNGCSLKAYRADLIKSIPLYSEMHRFIPAMSSLARPRIAEIEVRHHPRKFGASKYGFSRIYKVFLDLLAIRAILSFTRRPFAWFGWVAGAALTLSLIASAAVLWSAGPSTSFGRDSVVYAGLAVLAGSMGMFIAALGLLAQLIHDTRLDRILPFTQLAARPVPATPAQAAEASSP